MCFQSRCLDDANYSQFITLLVSAVCTVPANDEQFHKMILKRKDFSAQWTELNAFSHSEADSLIAFDELQEKAALKADFLPLELLIMSAEEAVRGVSIHQSLHRKLSHERNFLRWAAQRYLKSGQHALLSPNGKCYKSCCRKSHFFSLVNQPFYSKHDFQYFLSAFVFSFSSVIVKISSYLSTRKAGEEFSPFIFIFPVLL